MKKLPLLLILLSLFTFSFGAIIGCNSGDPNTGDTGTAADEDGDDAGDAGEDDGGAAFGSCDPDTCE